MRLANGELVRLSQQRKDFLNIAAHNLRAPIGAVTHAARQHARRPRGSDDREAAGLAGPEPEAPRRPLRVHEGHPDARVARDRHHQDAVLPRRPRRGRRAASSTSTRTSPRSADTTLLLEVPERVPPVVGHDRLLQEALVNYVTNAIKYTPNGGRIVVRVLSRPPMVRVEVSRQRHRDRARGPGPALPGVRPGPGRPGTSRTGSRGAASASPSSGASSSPTAAARGSRASRGKGAPSSWSSPPWSNEAGVPL